MPIALNCPNCSAPLPDPAGRTTVVCRHCQSVIKLRQPEPPPLAHAPLQPQVLAHPEPAAGPGSLQPSLHASVTPLPSAALLTIREHLARGDRAAAASVYQQAMGSSERDARDAVEAILAGLQAAQQVLPAGHNRMDDVHQLAQGGNTVGAVMLYRQVTGAGQSEAEAYVESVRRGPARGMHASYDPAANAAEVRLGSQRAAEVRQYLQRGQKIAAIKEFRDATGAGLKEAKDAVEALEVKWGYAQPRTPRAAMFPAGSDFAGLRVGAWIVLVVVVAAMTMFTGCGAYLQTKSAYRCSMETVKRAVANREIFRGTIRGGYLVLSPSYSESWSPGDWDLHASYIAPVWGSDGMALAFVSLRASEPGSSAVTADLYQDWKMQPLIPWQEMSCP